jgi:DNA processing protein
VVVVEAGEVSGAMITANIALEQNREVFAVPGSIFSPKSIGPHRLLREGAKLVQSVDDILEELVAQLDLFSPAPAESPQPPDLDEKSKTVYDLLSHEPCHIDELSRNLKMPASELMAILLDLELNSVIRQLPGKFFIRIKG